MNDKVNTLYNWVCGEGVGEGVCEEEEFTPGGSWVSVARLARIPISSAVYTEAMCCGCVALLYFH